MIDWLIEQFHKFLHKFIGKPKADGGGGSGLQWSLDQIIRYESTHFLFSCFMGWLVFCLIWTIFSSNKHKWSDRYTFRISLVSGLVASVTTHIFIDGFTTLA